MSPRKPFALAPVAIFLLACAALFVHCLYYYPFYEDDSFISLRYADRLLHGRGLTWNDGRPVEGYSNLLWVLLVALLGKGGVDLVFASRILGFSSMCVAIGSVVRWYSRNTSFRENATPVALGLLFFCASAPVAVWAIGGLEQPLLAALISLMIPMTAVTIEAETPRPSTILALSLVLGLITVTRPDGAIFTAVALASAIAGRVMLHPRSLALPRLLLIAVIPIIFVGSQVAFRWSYYGELVPNTALIKLAPGSHIREGSLYIARCALELFPFSIAIPYLLWRDVGSLWRRPIMIPVVGVCAAWMPYLFLIGGDVFAACRHLVPVVAAVTFAVIELSRSIGQELAKPGGSRRRSLVATLVCLAFAVYGVLQFSLNYNRLALAERWEWDGRSIALVLKQAFEPKQPLVAVTAAGCIPYFSDLPALDMLGLNDYYLPRHKPPTFGTGSLAHEISDWGYVLRESPDMVVFTVGDDQPQWGYSADSAGKRMFFHDFIPVRVRGATPEEYVGTVWFHTSSPKVGLRVDGHQIHIPAYLFRGSHPAIAYLNRKGRLAVNVSPTDPMSFTMDADAGSEWTATAVGDQTGDFDLQLHQLGHTLTISTEVKSRSPLEIEEVVLTPHGERDSSGLVSLARP